jgi:maleylacetate reductase
LRTVDSFVHEQLPQRIVFGWGRVDEITAEIDRLARTRVMLIAERSTAAVADKVRRGLGARFITAVPEARPHVPRDQADAARAQAAGESIDAIVTVGGGSATGLGKAIALEHAAVVVAIPTTYAGSEVTPIYGITDQRVKRTGRDGRVLPATVVYDPWVTTTLPPRVTASSGMNAIAHCAEALYAASQSPLATTVADNAMEFLREALPVCVHEPSHKAARTNALYGAYLAGSVLATTGMAVHHRICHVLGGSFGLPHGDVNAVVLPHALAFNEPAARDALAIVARAFRANTAAPGLFDFALSLGAPTSLRELGMRAADLRRAAEIVTEERFYNPRPVRTEDVLDILEAAFEGRRPRAV